MGAGGRPFGLTESEDDQDDPLEEGNQANDPSAAAAGNEMPQDPLAGLGQTGSAGRHASRILGRTSHSRGSFHSVKLDESHTAQRRICCLSPLPIGS